MSAAIGDLLLQARQAVKEADPHAVYDEALLTVSSRAAMDVSIGKAEIGALVVWKRITAQTQWVRRLMSTPDVVVRNVTAAAYERANRPEDDIPVAGQSAREELRCLPGMGGTGALASAVLLALAPDRMAVWDRRVGTTLSTLGLYPARNDFYGEYLTIALRLAKMMEQSSSHKRHFRPRDVDLALFHIAGDKEMLGAVKLVAVPFKSNLAQ